MRVPGIAVGEQPLDGGVGVGVGGVGGARGLHGGSLRLGVTPQQREARGGEQQDGEQAGADERRRLARADQAELAADRRGCDQERQRRRLHQAGHERLAAVEQAPVQERRNAAHDQQRQRGTAAPSPAPRRCR